MKTVSSILLAAGRSTRMERPKGLLPWQGRTLIESQVNAILQSSVCELVVVLGYRANVYAPLIRKHNHRIKIVVNDAYDEGKTASIRKGLKAIHPASEAVLIVNVDQPVTAHTVDRMIRHMEKNKKANCYSRLCREARSPRLILDLSNECASKRQRKDRRLKTRHSHV